MTDTDSFSSQLFSSLKIRAELLTSLDSLKYEIMTPIQAQSLPSILAGDDVIGQAKTGSGKTAAFGLGLLNQLDATRFHVQSLVLCPTRELADQVATEIRNLARAIPNVKVLTLCGGVPFGPQAGSLEHGAHIVVGTPGRIEDHLNRGTLHFKGLTALVLDEADRMLDMGFQDSVDAIVDELPSPRQTLLFSATFPAQIKSMSKRIMRQPVMIEVAATHTADSIEQHFYQTAHDQRMDALRLLLLQHSAESTLVFCNLKRETEEIASALNADGFSAIALNGDLEQRDRDQALVRFGNKSASILIATDVASRGLDIDALDVVINYQTVHDPETYVHRIGRTGRAGAKGVACTLFTDKDSYHMALLKDVLGADIDMSGEPLPSTSLLNKQAAKPAMTTLQIDGGKKQKVRPGDIVGALTGANGIKGNQIGKIQVSATWAYVAVKREVANQALKKLAKGKLKGRSFRVRLI